MTTLPNDELIIHLPKADGTGLQQDEEFFEIEEAGRRRRVRFHDYAEIFSVPGLYELLFNETLSCRSPDVVVGLLREALVANQENPDDLRVVDLGAGNGMVGEALAEIGADTIVGLDMLEEAKMAAERDRPGIYDAYHALDVTAPEPEVQAELESADFNCLTCVAALGFGDIPPEAFLAGLDLIEPDGWVAFNIRDRFVSETDRSGFANLLDEMTSAGDLVERARLRYPHRLGMTGKPLEYVAVVAQKA